MAKNIPEIPFRELVERVRQLARISPDSDKGRVRAAVNSEYLFEIAPKEDWNFLIVHSAITAIAPYRTGAATVNTGASSVTFTSDTVLDSTFTGRKVKFNDNSDVYELTFSNATAGTLSPVLSGDRNVSAGAFTIFQDTYALSDDFDRFPKNGGLEFWQGGRPRLVREAQSRRQWFDEYSSSPSVPQKCRVVSFGTAGIPHVQVTPPPDKAYLFPYDYLLKLNPMRETTAGFVDINSNATAVVGSAGTTRFTELTTGAYFRIDAFGTHQDSEWSYVNAIVHNSSLTLQAAFGLSGATTAGYVICSAPQMPALLHHAILAGAAMRVLTDQNDPQYAIMSSMKSATLFDARKLFKSRVASTEIETVAEDWQYRR